MEAMQIYKKLSQPPKSALRKIEDGKLKNKTDINPQWRYEAMTEVFGLVGFGWKYELQKLWTEPGANGETLAFAQVAVFVKDKDTKEWSDAIVGIGGSKLINKWSTKTESNDEGYKMAVTDAFSTSLKMLGVAADIYAGRWDGSKYKEHEDNEPAHQRAVKNPAPVQNGPAGGPDTPEEHGRINELLSRKYPDGTKMFSVKDCQGITVMRTTKTATEVILAINEEIKIRAEAWDKAHLKPAAQDDPVEEDPNYCPDPNTPALTPAEEKKIGEIF